MALSAWWSCVSAFASQRSENVAGGARGMHSYEKRLFSGNVAFGGARCSSPLSSWRKANQTEVPVGGRHVHLFAFLHDGLVREFVGYEVADRDEFHSHSSARRRSSGSRAMLPSSLIISIRAAAGNRPARRAKSTAASVCPARCSTPRSCAYSGLMCPGRPNVSGVASGSASARMVLARSCMLTPVEHPSSLSTVTVKGVPEYRRVVVHLFGKPQLFAAFHRDWHAEHATRAFLSMKFTCSGVIFSAATMRSPSFSRSSSSTTIMNLPSRKSSIASSMRSSLIFFAHFCFRQSGVWLM